MQLSVQQVLQIFEFLFNISQLLLSLRSLVISSTIFVSQTWSCPLKLLTTRVVRPRNSTIDSLKIRAVILLVVWLFQWSTLIGLLGRMQFTLSFFVGFVWRWSSIVGARTNTGWAVRRQTHRVLPFDSLDILSLLFLNTHNSVLRSILLLYQLDLYLDFFEFFAIFTQLVRLLSTLLYAVHSLHFFSLQYFLSFFGISLQIMFEIIEVMFDLISNQISV